MAKIEQACEFFNEDIRFRVGRRFFSLYGYVFAGGPKASKAVKDDTLFMLEQGLEMFAVELKNNNGYCCDGELTIADFNAFGFIAMANNLRLVDVSENETVYRWFQNMLKYSAIEVEFRKNLKVSKKILCIITYMVPVMRCMTCACCRS